MRKEHLKETDAVHKSDDLPMNIYRSNYVKYHWHDEYEFNFTDSEAAVVFVNGERYLLQPGDAIVMQSGDLHSHTVENGKTLNAIVMHPYFFASDEYNSIFSGKLRFQTYLSASNPEEAALIEKMRRIDKCFIEKPFGYRYVLKTLFSDIFSDMLTLGKFTVTDEGISEKNKALQELFDYVHSHYAERLSLDLLAAVFHYSKSYIIKLFKVNTGQTPIEYINRYRIHKAEKLLLSTDKSILEVALDCGFENVGYFIRTFKKYLNTTPKKYGK